MAVTSASSFPPLPAGQLILSGPYTLTASSGASLVGPTSLTLHYLGTTGDQAGVDLGTSRLYHWHDQARTTSSMARPRLQPYPSVTPSSWHRQLS